MKVKPPSPKKLGTLLKINGTGCDNKYTLTLVNETSKLGQERQQTVKAVECSNTGRKNISQANRFIGNRDSILIGDKRDVLERLSGSKARMGHIV